MIAPIALILCALAVFVVLTTSGSSDSKSSAKTEKTPSSESSTKSDDDTAGPTEPVRSSYTVKPGDSLSAIAEKTGVDIATLQELNPDIDARTIQPGQKLKLKE